ncbi:aminodeoxychorismate lyase [Ventosimonas gracilis]|uniref:Endolytic murein transglycosylase n=1 Tax=Ventosimonas gracilis TaxID=1680762 RepID=A0A139SPA9_9GAMM|nr:endolytic transglycosylase MltG [Ventosimonas gracilis]KXU36320.1 aminodeoxychorismate lyase [Ventosimonas gracilis]
MLRKLTLFALLILLLVGALLAFIWQQQHLALQQPLKLAKPLLMEVPRGTSPDSMLRQLEQNGLIKSAFWARVAWRLNYSGRSLQSGEYQLTAAIKLSEVLDLWQRGKIFQYAFTLIEGWNIRQLRAALAGAPALQQTLADVPDSQLMQHLGLPSGHPEGRFFPDTYRYPRGTSDAELLKRAAKQLDNVLAEEWAKRADNLPYSEPYQALIMASLIEKETGVAHEREEISGVFVRRLARGMRLQTDPTVIYGMGERYNGKLTRAHLREPTPYNTYQIDGLPPTPIALASRAAIHAALHPKEGNSLFFVAKGDGSHRFSDTLDAHNRAVREFQLSRRADYRSTPAPKQQTP